MLEGWSPENEETRLTRAELDLGREVEAELGTALS